MKFEEKLVRLRKREGFTQQELAAALDVSRQAISKWEVGTAVPSTDNLIHLGRLFGVSVDVLVNNELNLDGNRETAQPSEVPVETDAEAEKSEPKPMRREVPVKVIAAVVICLLLVIIGIRVKSLSDQPAKDTVRSWDSLESEIIDNSSLEYITMYP